MAGGDLDGHLALGGGRLGPQDALALVEGLVHRLQRQRGLLAAVVRHGGVRHRLALERAALGQRQLHLVAAQLAAHRMHQREGGLAGARLVLQRQHGIQQEAGLAGTGLRARLVDLAHQVQQPAGAPVGELAGAFGRRGIGRAQVQHDGAGQAVGQRQRVGQQRLALLVAAQHAGALAQRLGGDVGEVGQVPRGRLGGHGREGAIGLGHQHQAGAGLQQGLAQHGQPGLGQLVAGAGAGQGLPGVGGHEGLRRQGGHGMA